MYLSIFEQVEKEAAEGLTIDPASLYCAFEQVRDGRKAKGKRYPLPLLLTVLRVALCPLCFCAHPEEALQLLCGRLIRQNG